MKIFKNKILQIMIMIFIVVTFFIAFKCQADANGLEYSANPILDSKLKKLGYFKYEIHSNQKIKFPFIVSNNSNHDINISNTINDAYSSNNGNISYDKKNAPGLLVPKNKRLSSMVIGKRTISVHLKPHTYKRLYFIIKTPKKLLVGSLLGGINTTSDSHIDSGNISNKFEYSTTILLNNKSKKSNINKISLFKLDSFKNNLNIIIHNSQSNIVHGYKINVQLRKHGRLISNTNSNSYGLVPNSLGKYNLNLFNVNSGNYKVIIKINDNCNHNLYIERNILINNSYQFLGTNHYDNGITFLIVEISLISIMIIVIGIYIILKV